VKLGSCNDTFFINACLLLKNVSLQDLTPTMDPNDEQKEDLI